MSVEVSKVAPGDLVRDRRVPVKVTTSGHITEIQYMSRRNHSQTIQMLDGGEEYLVVRTGEIKKVCKGESRSDNKKGLAKTFKKLRDIINANVTDVTKVRWCTLTYAENMQDTKRLYKDFEAFNKRFQRYVKSRGWSKPEYISVAEPQARGAWHLHLLYIWQDQTAPYIPNDVFADLWGHGFVRIGKLEDVDNVGAYLTAYLGDVELNQDNLKEVAKLTGGNLELWRKYSTKETEDKKYIKGGRLCMYPSNFNIWRSSRGVKQPVVEMMSQEEAEKKVLGATKTFEKTVKITDTEHHFTSVISTEYYNNLREL